MEQQATETRVTAVGLWLAIAASAVVAAIGAVLLPLWVEDTTVLFHRANHTDLSIPFYYQGYISLPAQIIATLVIPLPAYLQAVVYAAAALVIWSLMLTAFFRVAPLTVLPFAGLAYFFTFDLLYVFNLTYSLWPALVFIGLTGVLCQLQQRPLSWWEAIAIAILSLSSPLSAFMALPLLPVVLAHRRNVPSWIALLTCLSAYPLLTEPGAGASTDLIAQIAARLTEIAANPGIVFSVAGDRLPISPPRLLRVGALLLCLGLVVLSLLPAIRRRYGALLSFVLSSLLIFLISLTRETGATIGTRYMFPVLFAGLLIGAFLLRDMVPKLIVDRLRLAGFAGLLAVGIALCLVELPNPSQSLEAFQQLRAAQLTGETPPLYLPRPGPFNPNDWTLAVGYFAFSAEDCIETETDEPFQFQIHCGPGIIRVAP